MVDDKKRKSSAVEPHLKSDEQKVCAPEFTQNCIEVEMDVSKMDNSKDKK